MVMNALQWWDKSDKWFGLAMLFLALWMLLPEVVLASEGVGGTLPYESWLINLRNSVTAYSGERDRAFRLNVTVAHERVLRG